MLQARSNERVPRIPRLQSIAVLNTVWNCIWQPSDPAVPVSLSQSRSQPWANVIGTADPVASSRRAQVQAPYWAVAAYKASNAWELLLIITTLGSFTANHAGRYQ